ncbi:MAG: hypothetical protein ACRCUS_01540, partial [Anaerovoracaceae bacterium]
KSYKGKYLYTVEGSKPFEAMLAEVGEYAIEYENDKYSVQVIIGFCNWPTSDPLSHRNEPEGKNNMQGFDVEKIKSTTSFLPGMVASYHVYPYYPEFLNFEDQMRYINKGELTEAEYEELKNSSPYRQYLVRLQQHHTIPIVISEYGVPTSRGNTHDDLSRGFDQGGLSEKQQGEMLLEMEKDIIKAKMNGAIVFAWQDEWFKRTWNTMEMNTAEGRARWHDKQTSEQNFGLIAFEPVIPKDTKEPFEILKSKDLKSKETKIFVSSNADGIMVKILKKDLNISNDKFQIAFDITPNSGIVKDEINGKTYTAPVDFILDIDGKNKSRLYVDKYYDVFQHLMGPQFYAKDFADWEEKMSAAKDELNKAKPTDKAAAIDQLRKVAVPKYLPEKESKNTTEDDRWGKIFLRLRNTIYLPETKETIKPSYYETGILQYGEIRSEKIDFSNLNDFCQYGNVLAIKIPWGLLNISDPSQKKILSDFNNPEDFNPYINGGEIPSEKVKNIKIGFSLINKNEKNTNQSKVKMNKYSWKNWETVEYKEREKASYYILQKAWNRGGN